MKNQLAAALIVVAAASGCAEDATAERAETGRITVDGTTHTTQTITCEQYDWLMIVDMTAEPAHARTLLQLGGEQPSVKTVNIVNFDGFYGVAGEGAEASAAEGTYTITGTAEGSSPDTPGQTRTVPFRIEAPC
jgi:lipoprotein LpqH